MFQEDYQKEEYSCFDFLAYPMFTFDVFWGSLGISIFGKTQVRPQIILDPDYSPDYLSVSYDYELGQCETFLILRLLAPWTLRTISLNDISCYFMLLHKSTFQSFFKCINPLVLNLNIHGAGKLW